MSTTLKTARAMRSIFHRTRFCLYLFTSLGLLAVAVPPRAQDTASALPLVANCFTCHGSEGSSPGSIPSIDGKTTDYLLRKLRGFRDGSEENTIMDRIAKGYSDEQLQLIANYLAQRR